MTRLGVIDSPPKIPFVMGSEVVGVVTQTGKDVTRFKVHIPHRTNLVVRQHSKPQFFCNLEGRRYSIWSARDGSLGRVCGPERKLGLGGDQAETGCETNSNKSILSSGPLLAPGNTCRILCSRSLCRWFSGISSKGYGEASRMQGCWDLLGT